MTTKAEVKAWAVKEPQGKILFNTTSINYDALFKAFEFQGFIEKGYALIPLLITTNLWISIKDRMPEENQRVLMYGLGDRQFTALYQRGEFWAYNPHNESLDECEEVTHWMALPEAPVSITEVRE